MPLSKSQEDEIKGRILRMFMDTINTFELLAENSALYFGKNSYQIEDAINEYLQDFIYEPDGKERVHPKVLIYKTSRVNLQSAGFYGAQLDIKERQVTESNSELRESILSRVTGTFKSPFKKWADRINNFLGSLGVTGVGEALKEFKDCMKNELPGK